jgi:hypothetical protein
MAWSTTAAVTMASIEGSGSEDLGRRPRDVDRRTTTASIGRRRSRRGRRACDVRKVGRADARWGGAAVSFFFTRAAEGRADSREAEPRREADLRTNFFLHFIFFRSRD